MVQARYRHGKERYRYGTGKVQAWYRQGTDMLKAWYRQGIGTVRQGTGKL
jgi:hypothetical protein